MRSKKILYSFLFLTILLWFSTANVMAADTYAVMIIEGESQGVIVGEGYGPMDDVIFVASFGHSVNIPADPQTGQPTGRRVHNPLRVVKAVDRTTPLLFQALVSGERLRTVEIRFYQLNSAIGQHEHFFTMLLEDAVMMSIAPSLIPAAETSEMMEIVTFTYAKITWTQEIDGIESGDDWRVPI